MRKFFRGLAAAGTILAFGTAVRAQTIVVDANGPARPFPHFWERAFGSGRANLSLRESYRDDLRLTREATGFEYVRFHGIFDEENGVYAENGHGEPVYNWTYVDQIYDGLLHNGVRPFVELSFMPSKLASSQRPHAFWYKPLPNPPADYAKWGALVEAFTRHVVERYGIEEVSRWIFEVWNEPNIDFWTGEPPFDTYLKLYASAAKAVKNVSSRLRVGGPATAQAAWVARFIGSCVKGSLPVDFISTHVYGNDSAENVFGTHDAIQRSEMVALAARKVHEEIRASAKPDLPLYLSEFNATYMNETDVTDSPYIGPWLANTIRLCDGLTGMMSYWAFSDVFEERGVAKTPFYGGYGLIAVGGIPKAAFNDFRLLHRLGEMRISNASSSVLVTQRKDGSLAIAVWNYSAPEEAGAAMTIRLELKGLSGRRDVRITTVDEEHGSPLRVWDAMGKPAFPSPAQRWRLLAAGKFPEAVRKTWTPGTSIKVAMAPKALALVDVR